MSNSFTDRYGIADARIKSASQGNREKYRAMAVNGRDQGDWVPVTNTSIDPNMSPNFVVQAWVKVEDEDGSHLGYHTVSTEFRIVGGTLECFVPGNTKFFIGIGVVGY